MATRQLAPRRQSSRGVTSWSPRREMERIFEDFFRDFRELTTLNPSSILQGINFPSIDMYEEKDRFVVKVEVPGLEKEDIHISVVDHALQLRGEVKKEETKDDRDYHYNERAYGAFFREIPLPSAVNTDQIRATFKNGILTIEMPKSKESAGKEIKIESK
jgi:HSP20 family protein